jgi:hypothetical protein
MKPLCFILQCDHKIIREEWLLPDKEHKTVRLLRFLECTRCHDTTSTITSPEPHETRNTAPSGWRDNGIIEEGPAPKPA